MINKSVNPVEWAGLMYELEDAHEHLADLIADIEKDPEFDERDFQVQLAHIFSHLNRAGIDARLATLQSSNGRLLAYFQLI
ncbi:MAG: hypothetical protein H6930_08270 [Rhodoferax sp.]|nr:hypothetical protein [Rhodoferax sp.]